MSIKSPFHRQLEALHVDGPRPRQGASPLLATRCYCDFGVGNKTSGPEQSQSADTNQVGVTGDKNVTLGNSSLGNVNVTSSDPDVARAGLDLASDLGRAAIDAGTGLNETAANLGKSALENAADLAATAAATANSLGAESQKTARAFAESAVSVLDTYLAGQNDFVKAALTSVSNQGAQTLQSVNALTDAGLQASAKVADSQAEFVGKATGQDTIALAIKIGAAAAVGIILLPALLAPSKKSA